MIDQKSKTYVKDWLFNSLAWVTNG